MKNLSTLRFQFMVLAALAGVHTALAQPTLRIAPVGQRLILYWPTTSTNYIVQAATNPASPNWISVTNAVPVNDAPYTAVAVTPSSSMKFFRLSPAPPVPVGMALIPAETFIMGDTLDGESDAIPTNDVTVTNFYMDVNLVSYGLWTNVSAYATTNGYGFVHAGAGKNSATNQPVQTVDWYDCVKWCNARSQQAGLDPVYFTDTNLTRIYTNGETTNVFVNWSNSGYRLPTEAEWEMAARGGSNGLRFPWGNTISATQANYYGCTNCYSYDLGPDYYNAFGSVGTNSPATSPVGSFAANGYGLYDMAGNVLEWCWDWYAAPPYPSGSPYLGGSDPHGAGPGSGSRVLRGGNWVNYAYYTRCACRIGYQPHNADSFIGFRCVKGL